MDPLEACLFELRVTDMEALGVHRHGRLFSRNLRSDLGVGLGTALAASRTMCSQPAFSACQGDGVLDALVLHRVKKTSSSASTRAKGEDYSGGRFRV
jgi:hypothetical protein